MMIEGQDGTLTPFRRDKLFISIFESCKHRPTALTDASSLTQTVINTLLKQRQALLTRGDIVKSTSGLLRRYDRVAATMYVAYHPH